MQEIHSQADLDVALARKDRKVTIARDADLGLVSLDYLCLVTVKGAARTVSGPVDVIVEPGGRVKEVRVGGSLRSQGDVVAASCFQAEVVQGTVDEVRTGRAGEVLVRGGHVGDCRAGQVTVTGEGSVFYASGYEAVHQHGGTVWQLSAPVVRVTGGFAGVITPPASGRRSLVVLEGCEALYAVSDDVTVGQGAVLDSRGTSQRPARTRGTGKVLRASDSGRMYTASSSPGSAPLFDDPVKALLQDGAGPVRWFWGVPWLDYRASRTRDLRMEPLPGLWDRWNQASKEFGRYFAEDLLEMCRHNVPPLSYSTYQDERQWC